ncbi:MAG: Nif3-like dinuclear metal center hexameric protein [Prevotellaceae bacterium]|jgi:dinuclear metal center YbgI/SA1388 family protein|nr:Nif3-like dinuclear metal center hexameric protein [Prevotellaceae bacterium]
MTVSQVVYTIEQLAPRAYQESYDNAGLNVGDPSQKVTAALLCLDVTEEIVKEAIQRKANLIISHHPVIFGGLKQIAGRTEQQRIVSLAIKHDIALYAAHTNLDSIRGGLNDKMCDKLGLNQRVILQPQKGKLVKIITFVPKSHVEAVRSAMFNAGAGRIGEYDSCSFNTSGTGTFRAGQNVNPFVGKIGELHQEEEIKVEVVAHEHAVSKVVNAMIKAHPYEEVAYDLYPLLNAHPSVGLGMVGVLPKPLEQKEFLSMVKKVFNANLIKYTHSTKQIISKVAVCSGSGAGFIGLAMASNADAYVSADFKYHDLQGAPDELLTVDVGHYESESPVVEIFYDVLTKKIPNFAVHLADSMRNPVKYL